MAPSTYPFYLLEELAEDLLKSAKTTGSAEQRRQQAKKNGRAGSYIDFHLVTGASSHDIATVREEDYLVQTDYSRTLRPYPRDRLETLQQAVSLLQGKARLPRSKQHDLMASALEPRPQKAQRLVREVFSRCKPGQREGLQKALQALGPLHPFPWSPLGETRQTTALVDLMEAIDLFSPEQ
jgi:hypothetical protein